MHGHVKATAVGVTPYDVRARRRRKLQSFSHYIFAFNHKPRHWLGFKFLFFHLCVSSIRT